MFRVKHLNKLRAQNAKVKIRESFSRETFLFVLNFTI